MKRTVRPATLFDAPQPSATERLLGFAREFARRHRGRPADPRALVVALRSYHAMWSLFSDVPALDRATVALAVETYERERGTSRRSAA